MTGQTTNGLPYPDPTDPISQGATAIKNLATAMDPHGGDTGWVVLAVVSGAVIQNGRTPKIRKFGGVVYLDGQIAANGSGFSVTIPAGYRPATSKRFAVSETATQNTRTYQVNADGTTASSNAVGVDLATCTWIAEG
jgi:hypothetical protein